MSARDVEPTRLDAAVAAMRSFVERLPEGFKVGLVQFSDASAGARRRRPPTTSGSPQTLGLLHARFRNRDRDRPRDRDRASPQSSLDAGRRRPCPGRKLPAAIVLLSDGKQNQGQVQPARGGAAARKARGIPVDTVALGTKQGVLGYGPYAPQVAPDPPLMRRDRQGHGRPTATATDRLGELATFYQRVGQQLRPRDRDARHQRRGSPAAAALLLVGAVALGRAWAGAFS